MPKPSPWTRSGVRHREPRWYWVCQPGGECATHPVELSRCDDGSTYVSGNRGWLGVSWNAERDWLRSRNPIIPPQEPKAVPHA